MNRSLPDVDFYHGQLIPSSSSPPSSSHHLLRKSAADEDDIMELLWHNGQVVLQNQTQLKPNVRKSSSSYSPDVVGGYAPPPPPPDQNLFIQEDEMASWLHYPIHEDYFCSDLLCSSVAPSIPASQPQSFVPLSASNDIHASHPDKPTSRDSASMKPLVSPERRPANEPRIIPYFADLSRSKSSCITAESGLLSLLSTKPMVSESPSLEIGPDVTLRADETDARWTIMRGGSSAASRGGASLSAELGVRNKDTAAVAETSGMSYSIKKTEQVQSPPLSETEAVEVAGDRKRKGREATVDETEGRSEETKPAGGSTSMKRSRAAEVHNLSERKRRDRINEKMKILQELVPRCNKSDKASMLEEAIEYMKQLQQQVQMMSMGYGMTPLMYPGMEQQQYMQPMTMAVGMPIPNMVADMAHMPVPGFPAASPFPGPNIQASDASRLKPDQTCPIGEHPVHFHPYNHQYLGLHPLQASMLQRNQSTMKASNSNNEGEEENH